ncbi:MAG: replication-associated recombination protein A [Ruminococcus sp.]|nr:replication-associated recombination protein A [Ruminococcus sp.]
MEKRVDKMELLANNFRPKCLKDVIGQQHLIGDNKVISNLVKNGKIYSMILYGKPGIGKTSIASAIINELNIKSKFLNATTNNKADFDIAIEEAKMYGEMILVIDEIHRMNKDKQDILLPHIESGLIILIGLTTSNPYHKINPAIRSRCSIYELHELSIEDIVIGLKKVLKELPDIKIKDDALEYIATLSAGDFRSAINTLEICYYATSDHNITIDAIKNVNNKPVFVHDKNEDGHYDVLSAFQKSIRGSDVDASLHYLARLLVAGDLDSIYRRMSVIAYEDIGLANPAMGPKVMAAIHAAELVGLPEAQIPLGIVVTELALSPKSNSAYLAINEAVNDINKGLSGRIPRHLINPSSDYLYPHNYKNDYVKQEYLPETLRNKKYYQPKNNKYEINLNKLYKEMRNEK